MYSVGEEFEKMMDDDIEYFTCLANISVKEKEYLICENEAGVKRVFWYDTNEEDLVLLEEDEEDEILEVWEEDYYGTDKDYMYWNEDFGEYDKVVKEDDGFPGLEDVDIDDIEDIDSMEEFSEDEEDLDEFLDDFLG
ncbi:hypothetical protein EII29_10050 [Leptotrichia sp. OH3620_COT-345]|uniref:hypothetical protein n=1 Tax=Leptotrichia sp. OH3620_COT-345 TaxID=2491048 RepID=UPI000F647C2B|nr:hypothetical protein [Leptotrichia sp. OH3620_COT-345]RRD38761.1 hypothetical protein EII29_10050 [Leptotrichia sp. OH3620_COT-345]